MNDALIPASVVIPCGVQKALARVTLEWVQKRMTFTALHLRIHTQGMLLPEAVTITQEQASLFLKNAWASGHYFTQGWINFRQHRDRNIYLVYHFDELYASSEGVDQALPGLHVVE